MNTQGDVTWQDLRADSWQSYVEREEQMESSAEKLTKLKARSEALDVALFGRVPEQAKLPLAPAASTHGATCAKCGRVFKTTSEYRFRGNDGAPICRAARACAVREEGNNVG